MTSYIKCEEAGEFIPKDEWEAKHGKLPTRKSRSTQVNILQDFVSPLDGQVIRDHKQLAAHNEKHGVTNIADYGSGHFEKRGKEMQLEATGQTPEAKKERKELIAKTLNDYGV